jgi:GGDEF domain-containing protein
MAMLGSLAYSGGFLSAPTSRTTPAVQVKLGGILDRAVSARWAGPAEAVGLVAAACLLARGPLAGMPGAGLPALAAFVIGARSGYASGVAAGIAGAIFMLIEAGLTVGRVLSPLGPRGVLAGLGVSIALGALGGLVGDAHRGRLSRGLSEARHWRQRHDELKVRHDVIVAAKEAQDRRVVGQLQTLSTLYEAAKALDVLDPAEILPATLRLAAEMLDAEAAAVYAVEGGQLVLVKGIGDRPERPNQLALEGTLAGRALRMRRIQAFEPGGDDVPDAWLAAPLFGKDGRPRAVVVIERLAFLRLTGDASQLLELLADWAGRALATTEAHAEARAQQVIDPATGVHHVGYMMAQLQREWNLAKRYSLPLTLLLVRQPGLAEMAGESRIEAIASLAQALRGALRQIDPVGHYRVADTFLAILPVTPPEQGRMLAIRLTERFAAQLPGIIIAASGNDVPQTAEAALQILQTGARLVEAEA